MQDSKLSMSMLSPSEGNTNKGKDIIFDGQPLTVTLEKINGILLDHLKNTIAPTVEENGNAKVVPILYGHGERWVQVRKEGVVRDEFNQKLLTPLIMIHRESVSQGQIVNPVNKYLYTSSEFGWNQRNVYDKFAVLNGIRPSRKLHNIMIPDYITLSYELIMWTDYQEQMDKLIEQLFVENYEFWGHRNNFRFRVIFDDFSGDGGYRGSAGGTYSVKGALPATSERIVRTELTMTVAAYLLPESALKNFKRASTSETSYTTKKIAIKEEIVNNIEN